MREALDYLKPLFFLLVYLIFFVGSTKAESIHLLDKQYGR